MMCVWTEKEKEREIKGVRVTVKEVEIYYKSSAHEVINTEKSQDLQLTSWNPGEPGSETKERRLRAHLEGRQAGGVSRVKPLCSIRAFS